jgi:uncharacterized membrane protein YczE
MNSNVGLLVDKNVNLNNTTSPTSKIRWVLFVSGLLVLSLGAATMITANLGAATWDVLHIGLANISNLSVGRWVQIIGVFMVLLTSIFEKKLPKIGCILNLFLVGFFLNCFIDSGIIPNSDSLIANIALLIAGIVLLGFGSGMYVASRIGAGPRDGMTLFISKRFSISVRLSRTILEVSALTIGWLIGGPVSVGTFASVVLLGPVMQLSLKFWTKHLYKQTSLA